MTDAELVVLSLIVERPRHGYEIEAAIVERNMREWTNIGFSSIYYLLEKLEKAGLATSIREPAPGRGPSRRVFSATEEGLATVRREALEAIGNPAQQSSSFLLGLAALPLLNDNDVADAIARHRQLLEARLAALNDRRALETTLANPNTRLPFHVAAMFDLSAVQIKSELDWIRQFAVDFDKQRRTERAGS